MVNRLDNNDDIDDDYDDDDDDDQATHQLDPASHRFPCRAWSSGGEPPDPLELRFPPLWNFLLTLYDVLSTCCMMYYGVGGWELIGFQWLKMFTLRAYLIVFLRHE